MRRNKAFGGRVFSIVVAGYAGYVFAGWNGSVPHNSALSAAQSVALRFPQDSAGILPATAPPAAPLGNAHVALLSPQPMVPQAPAAVVPTAAVSAAAVPVLPAAQSAASIQAPQSIATVQSLVQLASVQATEPPPPQPTPAPVPAARPIQNKPAAVAAHHVKERPGFVLNDAQIASIKERLHLTPGQEEMWPAVEAALRNIAYTHMRDGRKHGATMQLASADPEVQDLKSAAIPLIMSFNSEQKDEVRNLAHVMGLDQLASQF